VLRVPFSEKVNEMKYKKSKTDIFNDKYKQIEDNIKALRQKYVNNYVLGTLRSNLKDVVV
jgi:hypothetical protein